MVINYVTTTYAIKIYATTTYVTTTNATKTKPIAAKALMDLLIDSLNTIIKNKEGFQWI